MTSTRNSTFGRNISRKQANSGTSRGLYAYAKKHWPLAIAEFQRVLSFGSNAAASANIKRARSYQSWDRGVDALKAKNYDLAATYFQTAESLWHDPGCADLIRKVAAEKLKHDPSRP